ncbi:MAG TPA: Fic family protein [Mycobacteriales bacterium]|nr:Fic family protein [Mycobacteriales bacterium]
MGRSRTRNGPRFIRTRTPQVVSSPRLASANAAAMRVAIALADRLDPGAILAMHDALLGSAHPEWAGRWREDQVWIGGNDYSPHGAAFVPPHHDAVAAGIDDLCRFMARRDLPPLVRAAVAHAQFETIHPFPTATAGPDARWCTACCGERA